jgi:cytoskeletal protein CcmA (bactofilin family)
MMNNKPGSDGFNSFDTIIGKDTTLEGRIVTGSTVRLDGSFKGEIITKGDIFLGDSAKIEGDIKARNVYVGGAIQGNVEASGRVELSSTAKLFGQLKVGNLVIEEGAIFMGNCTTQPISQSPVIPEPDSEPLLLHENDDLIME